ncbi:hypothetical protein BDP27DRAFT_1328581 [Rhodocollybia butyracea]|uniref:Uncharacterized protein n=1 Tax=Rhodocollybia butyracea TaxID=206335 RepID=A0A9P5U6B5_9AGAR|nr:hypothetical protein BDP27DRAFT_1328581 [Rhodocollybia butyracea]
MCMWCLYHGSSLHSMPKPTVQPAMETVPLPKQGSNPGTPWGLKKRMTPMMNVRLIQTWICCPSHQPLLYWRLWMIWLEAVPLFQKPPSVRPISRPRLSSSSEPQSPRSSEPPSPLSECSSLLVFASPKIPRSSTPIIECQLMDSPEYACAARRKSESRFVRPQPTDEISKESITCSGRDPTTTSTASEFGHSPGVDFSSANRDSFHVLSRDDRDPSRLRKPTGSRRQIRQRRRSTRP